MRDHRFSACGPRLGLVPGRALRQQGRSQRVDVLGEVSAPGITPGFNHTLARCVPVSEVSQQSVAAMCAAGFANQSVQHIVELGG